MRARLTSPQPSRYPATPRRLRAHSAARLNRGRLVVANMLVETIGNRTDQPAPKEETREGNYFVSNYPPFSFWMPERVQEAVDVLNRPPVTGTPLGIYVHIPFCRKRCHFCYFKVYTSKHASEIEGF